MIACFVISIVVGGRLGYVVFYNLSFFIQNPIDIFKIWYGGMSFHGGFIGVFIACALLSFCFGIRFLHFSDLVACTASFGIFFARIANFINGELYGLKTNVTWGVIFFDETPRHPTQIYEAILEGLLLFAKRSFYF